MAIDDDVPEFTGTEQKVRAVPPPGKTKTTPPIPAGSGKAVSVTEAAPLAPVAACATELQASLIEYRTSLGALRAAEIAEGNPLAAFSSACKGPTQSEALKLHAEAELKSRADRVAQGLSPEARPAPTHSKSPIDIAAAQRGRQSTHSPGAALRSPVSRRGV